MSVVIYYSTNRKPVHLCMVEFTGKVIWFEALLCWEVSDYCFNLICYWSVQTFYFFLISLRKLYVSKNISTSSKLFNLFVCNCS